LLSLFAAAHSLFLNMRCSRSGCPCLHQNRRQRKRARSSEPSLWPMERSRLLALPGLPVAARRLCRHVDGTSSGRSAKGSVLCFSKMISRALCRRRPHQQLLGYATLLTPEYWQLTACFVANDPVLGRCTVYYVGAAFSSSCEDAQQRSISAEIVAYCCGATHHDSRIHRV
jgi:hypothetical protein